MHWKTYIIGMETQVPFHNHSIWKSFVNFVKDLQPEVLVGIGDHLDCPAPARWNRGTAAEYAGSLQKEVNQMKKMFSELRGVYDGPIAIHEGNHERRINVYARTKAPAFADLECLSVANLLDYRGFNITELPAVAPLVPGWCTTHDLGGLSKSLSKFSGGTALGYARKVGKSIICGHTHRLGWMQEYSHGKHIQGIETGHMMGTPSYTIQPNWQSGWAVVHWNPVKGLIHPELVNVSAKGKVHYKG